MAYIGKKPTSAPLTSSDVTDGIITSAKIVDGTIAAGDLATGVGVTDLQPIKSDISALALREATNESSAAFNLPNQFIETFTDDTNLGTETTGDRISGYWGSIAVSDAAYETGDRTSSYTGSTNLTLGGGSMANWVDGNQSTNTTNSWYTSSGGGISGGYHRMALASGQSKVYVGAKMYHQNTNGAQGTWKWQGSNDETNWTDLSSNFTWGSSTTTETLWSNNTAYRYIQAYGISGTTNDNTWEKDVEFKVATVLSSSATGTLIQSANAVATNKTKVGGTMLYKDNAGTATLGTDLKIYFTCDGGSNWTEASSYTAITPVYSTGVKQVRLGETTCTSGTDVRYKAVWANQSSGSKETQLHGIGVNY